MRITTTSCTESRVTAAHNRRAAAPRHFTALRGGYGTVPGSTATLCNRPQLPSGSTAATNAYSVLCRQGPLLSILVLLLTPLEALKPEAGEVLLQLRELRAEVVSLALQRSEQPG